MADLDLVRRIVRMRRGGHHTYAEIGKEVGLSEEQTRGLFRRHASAVLDEMEAESSDFEPDDELPDLEQLSRERREEAKRQHQDKLFKQLLGQKSQTDAIIEAILDSIPRVPESRVDRLAVPALANGSAQTGLLLLSDLHVGAIADPEETGGFGEYNYPKFRERLFNLRDAVRSITLRERHFGPVDNLVVASLGDIIENDSIFPAQGSMIDLDLTEQFLAAINDIAEFLVSLLDTYETIYVPCVTGNHGRIGRKGERKRHINWDYLVGKVLQAKLEPYSDRVFVEVPKAPFMVVEIEGHRFLFRHGDGIKSWGGIPYYGISRSVGRWTAIQATKDERFDYMCMGHFHAPASLPGTANETIINGCFPGVTEFSVEVLESLTRPMQHFGFVHPQYGLAARYPILLDRDSGVARVA